MSGERESVCVTERGERGRGREKRVGERELGKEKGTDRQVKRENNNNTLVASE